jgi:hypothetical protein
VGDPIAELAPPLILSALVAASWALRPVSRTLRAAQEQPA